MHSVYLDNAATTKMSVDVYEAMKPYLLDNYGNPSSHYDLGGLSFRALFFARKTIANDLQCNPQSIIFTSGGTESNNISIISTAFNKLKYGNHIITTKIEHPSVLNSVKFLEKNGFDVTYLDVDDKGKINLDMLKNSLRKTTILVSIMYANNEIGTIQPIKEISEILKNHQAIFHCDCVCAYGHEIIHPIELGIDLLSVSSHKIYGPKGVGFLYFNEKKRIKPFSFGGEQEFGLRAGTENVAGIAGLGKAVEILNENRIVWSNKEKKLRDYFIEKIKENIKGIQINGHLKDRLSNNINVSILGINAGAMIALLDREGVMVSSGSACMGGETKISHVIKAIGVNEKMGEGTLRMTLSSQTTIDEIDYSINKLKEVVEKNRKLTNQIV